MELLKAFGEEKMPSIINDPFKKTLITEVGVWYSKNLFSNKMSAWGKVEFKNGDTKGEQRFEGETFDEVVLKMKAMIENL